MPNNLAAFAIHAEDVQRARRFYEAVFGWKFEPVPGMEYALVKPSEEGISGGVGKAMSGPGWSTFYVKVDDVKQAVSQATRLGGRVLMPLVTLPDGMDIAVVADPEGHAIGLSSSK